MQTSLQFYIINFKETFKTVNSLQFVTLINLLNFGAKQTVIVGNFTKNGDILVCGFFSFALLHFVKVLLSAKQCYLPTIVFESQIKQKNSSI
jgi:hypothetical protein